MPAAYDIYAEQLRELRRGQALYYPEPSPEEGAVEIGDVGYTKQGAFYRLFNVSRPADDPSHTLGLPDGFQPLNMGRIRNFAAALEPGPLYSKTIFRVNADVGSSGAVLPADASFRFSCTSSRGAILMLETQMSRDQALHDHLFKAYLLQHCLSWYKFARDIGVQVDFGDIILVTECSKTAAWASAVYSQSSKEFGMSFSAGGAFLPSAASMTVSAGQERIGPVEYRRSQQRAITLDDATSLPKDHTVFVKGYRLGSRHLYLRSLARKIMKTKGRTRADDKDLDDYQGTSPSKEEDPSRGPKSPSRASQPSDDTSQLSGSFDGVKSLTPDWPDFHPAVALLAHVMETSDVEIAVVHDSDWCSTYSTETSRIIDDYVDCFFNEMFLEFDKSSVFENASSEELQKPKLINKKEISSAKPSPALLETPDRQRIEAPALPDPVPSQIKAVEKKEKKEPLPTLSPAKPTISINPVPPTPVLPPSPDERKETLPTRHPPLDAWRIALLGDGGVGKTALAVQFTMSCFVETYDPTIEDAYRRQTVIDQRMCFIEVIDTAGQEEYATLRDQWAREGQAFALVYSVSSRATFERLETFRQLMLRVKRQVPFFVLVGNKIDQSAEREVSRKEGEALAEMFGCEYIESSAKTGKSVDEMFFSLVRKLRGTRSSLRAAALKGPTAMQKGKSCILM